MVQDFSNVNMSLSHINAFLKDSGIEVSAEESAKLNCIFKESDIENENGEKKPDGILSVKERNAFLNKVKTALPKLFQKIVDFTVAIEVKEDLEAQRQQPKNK